MFASFLDGIFQGNFEIEITDKLKRLVQVHAKGSHYKSSLNVALCLSTDDTPYKPVDLSQHISNFIKDERDLCKIIDTFIEECENGDIVPVNHKAKGVMNVFTVPKKDSETGLLTKLRVVRLGSFETLNATSINDWILKEKCKMRTLPNLRKYVELLIKPVSGFKECIL